MDVEKITAPIGKGIVNNAAPSLTPTNGSLAMDVTTPGQLYVGDGANWNLASNSSGIVASSSVAIVGINLTNGAQPSFVNCTLVIQKITVGNATLKFLHLSVQQSITITGNGTWFSLTGMIPTAFLPNNGNVLEFPVTSNTSAGTSNTSYMTLNTSGNGSIGLTSTAANGALGFFSASCVYQ